MKKVDGGAKFEIFLLLLAIVGLYYWAYINHTDVMKEAYNKTVKPKIEQLSKVKEKLPKEKLSFWDKTKNKFSDLIHGKFGTDGKKNKNEEYQRLKEIWLRKYMNTEFEKTDSGLGFNPIKKSNSGEKPKDGDKVVLNYEGRFENGDIFESTYELKPVEFEIEGMIKGLQEGVKLMSIGDVYEFKIPPELAYGEFDYYDIPGNSTLIFKVELVDIK